MSSLQILLEKSLEKIKTVFHSVGCHVGFLLHYKQNLKNLEDEANNLQEQRSNVEGKVTEANRRGEAIDNNVSVWLKDADETRQGVDKFRDEKAVKENMLIFNFSCPNFVSRYRLSKEAKKKVVHIKHLTEEGGKIGIVSHSRDYEAFHSREKVFKGIVEALKDPKVNKIGIYGAGGVGKTTMVTKVGELVLRDGTFDEVVMAVVSQDANVIKIQGQLADCLNLKLSGETEVGRATQLWNRLSNGKKNLIILDDVWQELNLKEIGIPSTNGNKSCKVVLTSRNRDVWKNMDVKDFKIENLSEEESWALFKKKVGNYVDAPEPREIAWTICKECQGLPVAIIALGSTLKGKVMDAWQDELDKLKNSKIEGIIPKVFASSKGSYDRLDSKDAKSCINCNLVKKSNYINAAFRSSHRNQAYLFMKNEYLRLDYAPYSTNDKVLNGPLRISEGFPSLKNTAFADPGIDCAFGSHHGDEAFIFSGNLCARINYAPGTTNDKIIQGPMTIIQMFPFFKGTVFESGIDSAFESTVLDEAYLFKGNQYALINYNDPHLIAIRHITEGFVSLKDTIFESGIEAAFASHYTNEAYLFKGDSYVRINFAPHTTNDFIDSGVRCSLSSLWLREMEFQEGYIVKVGTPVVYHCYVDESDLANVQQLCRFVQVKTNGFRLFMIMVVHSCMSGPGVRKLLRTPKSPLRGDPHFHTRVFGLYSKNTPVRTLPYYTAAGVAPCTPQLWNFWAFGQSTFTGSLAMGQMPSLRYAPLRSTHSAPASGFLSRTL
ncbi:putative disease resistance protein At4g10780 [Rhododendron vialii]|uniref:putative disease resistance protein At4g10780 n=1 Tax=Rhododendron vialii TaxID=182163 RepID=UPI00265E9505|nr:putative disease resistance protein At4g10780 [Rhododendron vialii]